MNRPVPTGSPALSSLIPLVPLALGGLALVAGESLRTDYPAERKLRIDSAVEFTLETTDSAFERDGEPMENRFGGDMSTEGSRRVVTVDTVLESEEGVPKKVRRVFEKVTGGSTVFFGENERDVDLESPLEDVVLELTADDEGEVAVEVVEGSEPSKDEALLGHRLQLAFDALLPESEVEDGASWELGSGAVRRALGIDLESALFSRPEREEGGGGRGGGGGRRGGGRGAGGGDVAGILGQAEWEARATLSSELVDHEGVACRVIELAFEAEGEMPEREGGFGGRGRAFDATEGAALLGTTFKVELEGRLLFSLDQKRPVHFEVEGPIEIESEREMERQDSTMRIYSKQEGTYTQRVSITPVTE